MKHRWTGLLAALLAVGMLTSCQTTPAEPNVTPQPPAVSPNPQPPIAAPDAPDTADTPAPDAPAASEFPAVWQVTDEISLCLSQSSYPVGCEKLTVILDNTGSDVMLYGENWSISRWVDDTWVPMDTVENYGFTSIGYVLQDHDRQTLTLSPWFLTEPLGVGQYRITGCPLRVAEDDQNLSAGGSYTDYPAYELEFSVSEDAPAPTTEVPRADWQWDTPGTVCSRYTDKDWHVWTSLQDKGSLVAVCYNDQAYKYLGDLLRVDLVDRASGACWTVFDTPTLSDDPWLDEEGVFHLPTLRGCTTAQLIDGELVLSNCDTLPYALIPEQQRFSADAASILFQLENHSGKKATLSPVPHLEYRNLDGAWEAVPCSAGFCGVHDSVPVEGRQVALDLSWYELPGEGEYRLTMTGTDAELYPNMEQEGESFEVTANFTLVDEL